MRVAFAGLLAIFAAGVALSSAPAQQDPQVQVFFAAQALPAPLVLRTTPSRLRKSPDMQLVKPDGDGPIPEIIFMPPCGGHGGLNAPEWAEMALKRGYAALIVDL